ncbi:MAG: penicillin-binding protein 1C, partial [Syntrophothermus sp.]
NAPAMIYPGKNQLRLKKKRDALLDKLCRKGLLDKYQCDLAKSEPLPGKPYSLPKMAPHLTQRISAGTLAGQLLRTTLHQDLQDKVNEILSYHSGILKGNNIGNAAAIVVSVENGEVLAYAGNVQPDERSAGNDVDIITSPRSTGSILKPFLYASALNEGLILPNTLLPDIPMQIGGFMPENYNQTYDGAVPAREALARSLNVPAVKLLQQYGYEQLYGQLKKMGMSTLSRPADHYGLSLILGGAETTLWDLASIYSSMARTLIHYQKSGKYDKNDFRQIKFIPDTTTEHNFKGEHSWLDAAAIYLTFEAMVEVVRPDEDFQWQQFSSGSRIAWKTGTSYGNRDGWAVGITPGYVVAVWTGNAGGEGRPGLTGTGCAAPILFDIFKALPSSAWFESPLQEMVSIPVCTRSGFRASSACETSEYQWVPKKGLQTPVCPFHKLVHLDAKGEYQVTSACESPLNMIHTGWFILPPAQEYFFRTKNPFYRTLPPFKPGCAPAGIRLMEMIYPENNSRIYVPVDIDGKPGSTVFHVAHRDPSKKIYWHLDDKFLGTTAGEHKMSLSPEKGLHRMVLVDESGETLNVNFEILRK